jgi:hypothetical protein
MISTQHINPFAPLPLNLFRQRVGTLLQNDLHLPTTRAHEFTDHIGGLLGGDDRNLREISGVLECNEVRLRWNSVLREARSAFMADWVAPHVKGNMLDLLCGEGKVGQYLSRYGIDVVLTERSDAYDCSRDEYCVPYYPFDTFLELSPQPRFDTVLLCTVLHHEPDAEALLALSARLARRRIVIVENCLECDCPADYHLLVDIFFNECLNNIAIDCPANHRKPEEWLSLLSDYGKVQLLERRDTAPGIPLSHHLLVVDL